MSRQLGSSTVLTGVLVAAILVAVVALHPSPEMAAVRRVVGLGDQPVLAAPQVRGDGQGSYAFMQTQPQSSEPVGWDRCQPVTYAVNTTDMPDGAEELVARAVARISEATGLSFEYVGETGRRPFDHSPGRAEVVIGWGDEEEFPRLEGRVAGLGGSTARLGPTGRLRFVTGGVALDTDTFTSESVAMRGDTMEAIVVHELGHVVGLDHVDDASELMAAHSSGLSELGPGDREGLARLGSLPCG